MEPVPPGSTITRHRLPTRLWHWVNAVAILVLIGSGIGILQAHPRLYWGRFGANFDTAWADLNGWPGWLTGLMDAMTIPAGYSLAISRRWHLFFALVLAFGLLAFLVVSLVNRHLQRDLRLRRADFVPATLAEEVRSHWAFRFHDPARPAAYNGFQRMSYALVILVLIPLAIFTGIAMSPGMNAAWPWLLDVLGGRQSARSLHFIAFAGITLFTIVHLVLVILAGAWNETRSMLTGKWRVPE